VRLHEFGMACLVAAIEPLSPAEAAVDISGWSQEGSSCGLKLDDMVICINGKSIGSMTMSEFQLELNVCGPELILVVSRFEIQETEDNAQQESTTLEDLAMDWHDIGAGCASPERKAGAEEKDLDGLMYGSQDRRKREVELVNVSKSDKDAFLSSDRRDEEPNALQNTVLPKLPTALCKSESLSKGRKQVKPQAVSNDSTPNESNSRIGGPCASNMEHSTEDIVQWSTKLEKKQISEGKSQIVAMVDSTKDNKRKVASKPRGQLSSDGESQRTTVEKHDPKKDVRRNACESTKKSWFGQSQGKQLEESESTKESGRGLPKVPPSRYQHELEELSDDEPGTLPKRGLTKKKGKNKNNNMLKEQAKEANSVEDISYEDDENPWLGCVCVKIHPAPIEVFWIQCGGCNAWLNVAEECVGFDEKAAKELKEWHCWACNPPVEGLGL